VESGGGRKAVERMRVASNTDGTCETHAIYVTVTHRSHQSHKSHLCNVPTGHPFAMLPSHFSGVHLSPLTSHFSQGSSRAKSTLPHDCYP
jgi:hypothetical protein